jgi:PEP-CTERM motif
MKFTAKLAYAAAAATIAFALPAASNAATVVCTAAPTANNPGCVFDGESGTFGNSVVTVSPFSTSYTFTTSLIGELFASITTNGTGPRKITFTSVKIDGNPFTFQPPVGSTQFGSLTLAGLAVGSHTLTVSGTSGGRGSYSGVLSFTAVPEPAMWMMMILGFGAIGASMRTGNRRKQTTKFVTS